MFGLRGGYTAYLFGHRGQILIQRLSDVHRGKTCRINNVMDQRYVPLGTGQIVQLAVKKVEIKKAIFTDRFRKVLLRTI
jgi:hypothetical protein